MIFRSILIATLAVALVVPSFAQSGPQDFAQRIRDPLAGLKHLLQDAGAPALTSTQEQQLKDLISAFRSSQQQRPPVETTQAAHREFENAILSGDLSKASSAAAAIAVQTSTNIRAEMEARANFGIQVLNILRTNDDQVGIIQKRVGTAGLFGLVTSLAGGPGIGPGGPRPGGPH